MGDFDACRFDFRIDTKNGLTPSRRRRYNYNTFFNCKECGKLFETRPRLLVHRLVHNHYRCTQCGKSFSRRGALQKHIGEAHAGAPAQREQVVTRNDDNDKSVAADEKLPLRPLVEPVGTAPCVVQASTSQMAAAAAAAAAAATAGGGGYMCINMPLVVCPPESGPATVYSAPALASPCVVSCTAPLLPHPAAQFAQPAGVQHMPTAFGASSAVDASAMGAQLIRSPMFATALPPRLANFVAAPQTATPAETVALNRQHMIIAPPRCSCDDELEPGEIRRPKPCCHNAQYLAGVPAATGNPAVASPLPNNGLTAVKNEPTSDISYSSAPPSEARHMAEDRHNHDDSTTQEQTYQLATTPLIISRLPNGEHKILKKRQPAGTVASLLKRADDVVVYRCEMCRFPASSAVQLAEHSCPHTDHNRPSSGGEPCGVTVPAGLPSLTPADPPPLRCQLCGLALTQAALERHVCAVAKRQPRSSLNKMVDKLWQTKAHQPETPWSRDEADLASADDDVDENTPPRSITPITVPTPVAPTTVAPMPVAPPPVAPTPVAPTPVAPMPVAPTPVAPTPVAPPPPPRKRSNDYCTIKYHTCKFCRQLFDSAKKMREHAVIHEDLVRSRYYASRRLRQASRPPQTKQAAKDGEPHGGAAGGSEARAAGEASERCERLACIYSGCSTSVIGYDALLLHMEREHLKLEEVPPQPQQQQPQPQQQPARPLDCEFPDCRRRFSDWRHLKRHLASHAAEKPLACSLCAYACRHRSSMNWHMKTKHRLDKTKSHGNRTVYVDTRGNVVDGGRPRANTAHGRPTVGDLLGANRQAPAQLNAPAGQLNVPVAQLNAPVGQLNAPVAQLNTPVAPLNAPVAQPNDLITQLNAPVAQLNPPMAQLNEPMTQLNTPVAQLNTPVAQLNDLMTQLNAPVAQINAPMAQLNEPMTQLNTPVAQLYTPVALLNALMTQRNAPVAQINMPVAQLSAQVAQLGAPVAQLNAPMAQLSAPVAQLQELSESTATNADSAASDELHRHHGDSVASEDVTNASTDTVPTNSVEETQRVDVSTDATDVPPPEVPLYVDDSDEPIDMTMNKLSSAVPVTASYAELSEEPGHSAVPSTDDVCDVCGEVFDSELQLERHRTAAHGGPEPERRREPPLLRCAACDHVALTPRDLQCHLLATHGGEAAELRSYMCGACGNGFSTRSALASHASQQHPPAKCAQCGVRASSRPALARHMRRAHARVACTHAGCRQRFDSVAALRAHTASHASARPLLCRYPGCTSTFREAKHLRVHAMQHTDERPLACTLCAYACRQRNSMNWHMKSKHQLYKHVTVDGKTVYS